MITCTPVNAKSLAAFLCNQMVKLDKGEIDANQAIAQAKLASQVNNLMNYELKRTLVQIKLKEIEKYVVKNKGITYISDEGINLIFKGLNFNDDTLNGLTNGLNIDREDVDISIKNTDFKEFKLELKEFNKEYLNSLKSENEVLKKQLDEKDKQISELHKLIENSQILLKEEQKKSEQQLYLAEHFEEVDNKLQYLKEKMEQKRNEKIKFFKIFSK